MKKSFSLLAVIMMLTTLVLAGCQPKAKSSSAAIEISQSLESTQQKIDYLVGQAKAFYNSKEYQDAINTAKYVLSNLDNNSQQAKDIIEKAKEQLKAMAQQATDKMKQSIDMMGK